MIKNDKQYHVTKSKLTEFIDALNQSLQSNDQDIDPIYRKIEEDAIKSQIAEFEREIEEYEFLKKGNINFIYVDSLSNFYEALIKARIVKGWTHADLAKRLELKEQQIQRYELCNYSTASIARINQVACVLDIKMKPFKVKLTQPEFSLPEGFNAERILGAHNKLKEKRSLLTL